MYQESEVYGVPADAQRAEDLNLPIDASERKRVLNILAQRRYRRRRRERQAALESLVGLSRSIEQANSAASSNSDHGAQNDASPSNGSTSSHNVLIDSSRLSHPTSNLGSTISNSTRTSFGGPTDNIPWSAEPPHDDPMVPNPLLDSTWNTTQDLAELNDFLQSDEIQSATFADDFHIAVPELDLLRAAYENAGRINSSHLLFAGLTTQSVYQTSDCSGWILTLPQNLVPTEAQLTTPHHPAIDVLPWPAVRSRLIKMYNMPPDLWPRHPIDGTESGLVRFIYDMEDGGVRVTGPDPSQEASWEIQQTFFENWWWALDQAIIANSNLKRLARGQPMLCAPTPVQ